LKGAHIVFNRGYGTADCTVRNLTDYGALIEIPDALGIPSEFELQINPERRRRACRVIWRDQRRLGVLFVDSTSGAAPEPRS